jgi:hypothetical protein
MHSRGAHPSPLYSLGMAYQKFGARRTDPQASSLCPRKELSRRVRICRRARYLHLARCEDWRST